MESRLLFLLEVLATTSLIEAGLEFDWDEVLEDGLLDDLAEPGAIILSKGSILEGGCCCWRDLRETFMVAVVTCWSH